METTARKIVVAGFVSFHRASSVVLSAFGEKTRRISEAPMEQYLGFSAAREEVTMLHALENLLTGLNLTNGAKSCVFNPDGVFGNRRATSELARHWNDAAAN